MTSVNMSVQSTLDSQVVCEECGKAYSTRQGLSRHKLIDHDSGSNYTCVICDKKFYEKSAYTGHINMHAQNKSFSCPACKKSFYHKSSLDRHILAYSGKGEVSCDICSATFVSARGLKQHTEGKHGNTMHVCPCGKSYSWNPSLQRHQRGCAIASFNHK